MIIGGFKVKNNYLGRMSPHFQVSIGGPFSFPNLYGVTFLSKKVANFQL